MRRRWCALFLALCAASCKPASTGSGPDAPPDPAATEQDLQILIRADLLLDSVMVP